MVYKTLLWTYVFWLSYIKWYKFCNNNLSVLGSKQGGTLYNVLILKCVSITNKSIEHYMEGVVRQKQKTKQVGNEKQTFFERLYWVVFQLFIQKYYAWQIMLFDATL